MGQLDGARAEVERIASRGLENLPRNQNWMISLDLLAEVCSRLGDKKRAEELYELLLPATGSCSVVGFSIMSWGSHDRALGILAAALGRWAEAECHFELSLQQNKRVGALPWLAHARFDYARMLMRRAGPGDRGRARQLAGDSLLEARRLAMVRLTADVERFLEAPSSSYQHR